jgi:hypothetical protein
MEQRRLGSVVGLGLGVVRPLNPLERLTAS